MKGQWIGNLKGTNSGEVILNLDETDEGYEGLAYVHESGDELKGFAVFIKTPNKNSTFSITTSNIFPINPQTGLVETAENVKKRLSEELFLPNLINARFTLQNKTLNIDWSTDVETSGSCIFQRRPHDAMSQLVSEKLNWAKFKNFVSNLQGSSKFIFRGQNQPWLLRTGFHRTGRADLTRFRTQDIPLLHQKLSARTKHLFNLSRPPEFGAFLNLLQHHGYPMPMLDWTYSPYVAAFFAYRGLLLKNAKDALPDESVMIFVFNLGDWEQDFHQVLNLLSPYQHLSKGEFLAIENERMIPQQALTLISSIDDIEGFIHKRERQKGKQYLAAIDLPISERASVIRELAYMGLHPGGLFPGLDGICEELKERNFRY
jgi:hypothetical protein